MLEAFRFHVYVNSERLDFFERFCFTQTVQPGILKFGGSSHLLVENVTTLVHLTTGEIADLHETYSTK